MIPIIFAIIVENVTNPLHQVLSEYPPQPDLTFGIGDIVGAIALLVSAFTFYIAHTQASQSEQIKTSRELWSEIKISLEKAREAGMKQQDNIFECLIKIDYFAYLIVKGEIKDKVVIQYYRPDLEYYITETMTRYVGKSVETYKEEYPKVLEREIDRQREEIVYYLRDTFPYIYDLILKWKVSMHLFPHPSR